jgi:uncharacterized membrane protein YGL010W
MRSREQYMTEYRRSHVNPLNQVIHLICVPLIFVSSAGLLWSVSLAWLWPGASPALAPWLNLATLAALPILTFYARLGWSSFASGLAWSLVSAACCLAIQAAGLPLPWIAGAVWLLAWAAQFYGHKVEGAKPSLADDLVFLLIGPLFVQDKFVAILRGKGLTHA